MVRVCNVITRQLFTRRGKRGTLVGMKEEYTVIYGKHAVREALAHRPDIVRVVHLANEMRDEFVPLVGTHPILVKVLNLKKIPGGISPEAVHQGCVAEIDGEKLMVDYDDFMRDTSITNDTAVAILGEVHDPHNVGAVIRSAFAFGISAVIIPEHRQAQVNGTVIKVSVGTAFQIPLIQVGNVNQTIENLKERGFWVYGLAGEAEQSIVDEAFEKPAVIVLGNEGEGIRKKTLEHCDIPLRIPIASGAESLNASVAASIAFYAWRVRHPRA